MSNNYTAAGVRGRSPVPACRIMMILCVYVFPRDGNQREIAITVSSWENWSAGNNNATIKVVQLSDCTVQPVYRYVFFFFFSYYFFSPESSRYSWSCNALTLTRTDYSSFHTTRSMQLLPPPTIPIFLNTYIHAVL